MSNWNKSAKTPHCHEIVNECPTKIQKKFVDANIYFNLGQRISHIHTHTPTPTRTPTHPPTHTHTHTHTHTEVYPAIAFAGPPEAPTNKTPVERINEGSCKAEVLFLFFSRKTWEKAALIDIWGASNLDSRLYFHVKKLANVWQMILWRKTI